jgi:hypothetical protein
LIKDQEIGSRARILYFAIHYKEGDVFGAFQVYEDASGNWIATHFSFNTDAMRMLPSSLLSRSVDAATPE